MKTYKQGEPFKDMNDFASYMKNNAALFFNGKVINTAFVQNWQWHFIDCRFRLFAKAVKVGKILELGEIIDYHGISLEIVRGGDCSDCFFFNSGCRMMLCLELIGGLKGMILKRVKK